MSASVLLLTAGFVALVTLGVPFAIAIGVVVTLVLVVVEVVTTGLVFGGLGSLTGCFIASLLMGMIQTFAVVLDYSAADLLGRVGLEVTKSSPFGELLTMPLPRIGALLPYALLVLILWFRPRGLMGTRDT